MKFIFGSALAVLFSVVGVVSLAQDATNLSTVKQQTSYALGFQSGIGLKQNKVDIDLQAFSRGMQDSYNNKKPALTQLQMHQAMENLGKNLRAKQMQSLKTLKAKNLKISQNFLAKNKQKPGVKVLASGIQYKILSKGNGSKPKLSDRVTVDYEDALIDGTIFDSSYQRGKPATFVLSQVIQGWQDAMQAMPVGSTWMVYIPAKLAYGEDGIPGKIEPNQALIFKIHLISIDKTNK